MGDRRIVEISTSDGSFYIYTHWGGSNFRSRCEEALTAAHGFKSAAMGPTPNNYGGAALAIVAHLSTSHATSLHLALASGAEDEYSRGGREPSIVIDLVNWQVRHTEFSKTTNQPVYDGEPLRRLTY
jgi:hypothetical protein